MVKRDPETRTKIYIDRVENKMKQADVAYKYGYHVNGIALIEKTVGFQIVTDPEYINIYKKLKEQPTQTHTITHTKDD